MQSAAAAGAAAVPRQVPAMFSVAHKDPAANGVTAIGRVNKCVNSRRDRHREARLAGFFLILPMVFLKHDGR